MTTDIKQDLIAQIKQELVTVISGQQKKATEVMLYQKYGLLPTQLTDEELALIHE